MAKNILPEREEFCKLPRSKRLAIIRQLAKTLDGQSRREVAKRLGVVVEFSEN